MAITEKWLGEGVAVREKGARGERERKEVRRETEIFVSYHLSLFDSMESHQQKRTSIGIS